MLVPSLSSEYRDSMNAIMQIWCKTSQTISDRQALLSLIIMRKHLDRSFSSTPMFCTKWFRRHGLHCFRNKNVEEIKHSNINKAKYPYLGGTDSLSSLLTATILQRNQAVNRWPYGERALSGAIRTGTPSIILALKWGFQNNHRLLAFTLQVCSFS